MTKARDTANLTGSGVGLSLLDIDAGTDIGAALVDADLMIVDDGAGGTNRKATMARLATYMGTKIGGGMEFISSSGAISNAASVAFTGFDASKYDSYKFYLLNVVPATDNANLLSRVSINGGSSYDTTNGSYYTSQNYAHMEVRTSIGGASGETTGVSGTFTAFNPAYTGGYRLFLAEVVNESTSANYEHEVDAKAYKANEGTAINAMQFFMSSGNIESGEITMFGIVNS